MQAEAAEESPGAVAGTAPASSVPVSGFDGVDAPFPRKSANMTERVTVPSSEHVAEIVGRQGCKIKALRGRTNTYIKTPGRDEDPVFVITGRRDDVAAAKTDILSAADHFTQIRAATRRRSPGVPGAASSSQEGSRAAAAAPHPGGPHGGGGETTMIGVRVPVCAVGLVVGPRGATIKRIQQDTQTHIVSPGRDRDPVFEVVGSAEGVERARTEIESYLETRIRSAATTTGNEIKGSSGRQHHGHVIQQQQQQQRRRLRSDEKNLVVGSHGEQNLVVTGSHFQRTTPALVLNSLIRSLSSGGDHFQKRQTQPDIRSPLPLPVTSSTIRQQRPRPDPSVTSCRIFDVTAHARSSADVNGSYEEAEQEDDEEEEGGEEEGKEETGSSRDVIVSGHLSDLNNWLAERSPLNIRGQGQTFFSSAFPSLMTHQQQDPLTSGSKSANFDGFPVLDGLDVTGAALSPPVGAGHGGFLERCLLAATMSSRSGARCGPASPSSILLSPPSPSERIFRSLRFSRSPSSSPTESTGSSG